MELDFQPQHVLNQWHERPQPTAGPSASYSSSSISQRRRSSAAHTRPAGPPPNQPIPSIPFLPDITIPPPPEPQVDETIAYSSYSRPVPSPGLTAVAAFSQSRMQQVAAPIDDLSDPPPQSMLHPSYPVPPPPPEPEQSPSSHSRQHRPPSSRRALTRALELAREAVQLDSTNDHPEEAVMAYGRSVALLSEVMERVRRGESSEVSSKKRNGRPRSGVAQEAEVRRLQNIHDTYADRMNILCIAYSIPPIPYSTSAMYPGLGDSTQSTSPTTSGSPMSDTAEPQIPQLSYTNMQDQLYQDLLPDILNQERDEGGVEAIGAAMFLQDLASPIQSISGQAQSSSHPYASAASQHDVQMSPQISSSNRVSLQSRRSRGASAALPPALPPPANSLPPAPAVEQDRKLLEVAARQRGDSVGHKRTGSGSRLAVLEEETERFDDLVEEQWPHYRGNPQRISRHLAQDHHRPVDSPPLPPLPSPTLSQIPSAPRNLVSSSQKLPPSPRLSNVLPNVIIPRPRGSSQMSVRPETAQIINPSISQGTIIQRRKTSAPPTPRSSSPDSVASVGSLPRPTNVGPVVTGRSRSFSQPGRRPMLTNGRLSPVERPPLPNSAGLNGPQRKSSFPAKPNPLSVQTDIAGPIFSANLAPPSAMLSTGLPTTPTSPLPPVPPSDPIRKPYHLMNLLRTTMVSATGGYITRRLHVPQEVWSQGGAKLTNLIEKIRVVGILCAALEEIQNSSSEYFGAGNVSSGMGLGIGSIGRKEGEAWIARLEDFSTVCDGVVANFGKKLGVGEGFVVKKTTWGGKLGRQFDKFTNGKNLDSPAAYVQGLRKLFLHAQLLDEHARAVTSQPVAPAYASFPPDIRSAAEIKLKRSSEFFASVVLTFVIRDLSQLLDKYAKKCEKWMAE
ncbi:hypothetical protein C8J56DRAFT_1041454 [Mycena floridula]|nr:hypothetical protein C8J56DRAFT_1041454 [Mycena floridula]